MPALSPPPGGAERIGGRHPGLSLVLSRATALSHLAFVALLVAGGPLGRRHPRLIPAHLAAVASAAAINLTGSDCPLTTIEKDLLRRAGRTPYETGFVSHYLVEPLHPTGIDGRTNRVLLGAWVAPTALAYLAMGTNRRRRQRQAR